MTTLITAALIVFGIFGYRLLSVAALPAVDFPDHPDHRESAGREPGNHGRIGCRTDRASAFDDRRHHLAHLDLVARLDHHHHPVRSQPEHRWRRARRADRAHGGGAAAADRDDDPAVFPEGQSGRFLDPAVQPGVADAAAVGRRRLRRNHAGAADFAVAGHRPGADVRRAEIRRPRPGRSGGRSGSRHFARRHPQRGGQGEFEHAGRHHRRARPEYYDHGERRDAARRRVQGRRRRLSQRAAASRSARWPRSSTPSRTTWSPISTTTSNRSCWRSSSSRTPIPSRSSTPSASACRSTAPRFRRR